MSTYKQEMSSVINTDDVFETLCNNDLSTLKNYLTTWPDCYKTVDAEGHNLLHLAIILELHEIFDYLLSLDKFDLEAITDNGDTALSLCLVNDYDPSEYFALELIKSGANVDYVYGSDSLLHLAAQKHQFQVAKALLERGIEINAQNDSGSTPFHLIFHRKTDTDKVSEGVGLLMYYGADPTIEDNCGNIPFELAVLYDPCLITVQESLMYYTFDEFSEYKMSVEVLLELLETKSVLFFEIINYVSEIVPVKGVFLGIMHLFSIELQFLVPLVQKLEYFVKQLLDEPVVIWNIQPTRLENYEFLLNNGLESDMIQFIANRLHIRWLIEKLRDYCGPPYKGIIDLIFYLLTYGLDIYENDLDAVYKNFGYCYLFKIMLSMDIKHSPYVKCDIMPRLIYDLNIDLDTFLADPHDYSINTIITLLDYYACPKLKDFCYKLSVEKLVNKAQTLPKVPLLLELGRDATRKFLVQKYSLRQPHQLCSILKWLPISQIHAKIILFETKLYRC